MISWPLSVLALFVLSPLCLASTSDEDRSLHVQGTMIPQYHNGFQAPYSGDNSLPAKPEYRVSYTSTVFLGQRIWDGVEVYFNPELSAGSGIGGTHGVADFPNGEIFRVDSPDPKFNLSRLYVKRVFGLGGEREELADDLNQIAETIDRRHFTVILGKFSLNDFFDNNLYSHDPRTQFFNWTLMDNGAWDYAADTRGYTWGFYVDYNEAAWSLRFASVLEPSVANGLDLDLDVLHAHGDNLEFEYRYLTAARPGRVRLLAYLNHAHMGNYETTIRTPEFGMNIANSRSYSMKYGFGLNLEQELVDRLGAFLRAGWNDGATESWAFTEVDRTLTFGLSRKDLLLSDEAGLAFIWNGISAAHASYLGLGGDGFMLGDGMLNYAPEEIVEAYYLYQPWKQLGLTADFQYIGNPGYNQDRGPAVVYSGRVHVEF